MPTKKPRVNIIVEPSAVGELHSREDVGLAALADSRMKTFDKKTALSHEDVWK